MKRLQLKTPWKAENIALRDALSVSPETPLADILHKIQAREQAHAKLANAHHDLVEACKLGLAAMIAWGGKCEAQGESILAKESVVQAEKIRSALRNAGATLS